MDRAKEIVLKVIPYQIATPFVKAHHYSGKVVNNSKVHFGDFLDGKLHGVISYGTSMDKNKIIGLLPVPSGASLLNSIVWPLTIIFRETAKVSVSPNQFGSSKNTRRKSSG